MIETCRNRNDYTPEQMDGLFAGQFKPEDYLPYVERGEMYLSYEGPAGFFCGLAILRKKIK